MREIGGIVNEPGRTRNDGCFIATAAYGTPLAEEINILRNWRDHFLKKHFIGILFIKIYYSLSPPIANNISKSDIKKSVVKKIIGPFVKILANKFQ